MTEILEWTSPRFLELRKGFRFRRVPYGRRCGPDYYRAKWPRVITMRQAGATLDEIGKAHSCTHENIRRILARIGDPTLIGFAAPLHEAKRRALRRTCVVCNSEFVANSANVWRCSPACAHRQITDETIQAWLAARRAGTAWTEISRLAGYAGSAPSYGVTGAIRRWSQRTGTDVSWAFGWWADRRHRRDQSPPEGPAKPVGSPPMRKSPPKAPKP